MAGMTAQQLVALACSICNVPGRIVQVGQLMNMILADYAQTIDEDVIRKTVVSGTAGWVPAGIGPPPSLPYFWNLPTDYLRFYDGFYNINGAVFQLKQLELDEFDGLYTAQGIDNYPEWFATDMGQAPPVGANGLVTLYPPPAIPITITLRYRPQTADIVTPESSSTIPWFPNQRVLLKDLCVEAGSLSDDGRVAGWEQEVDRRMKKYLVMSDDKENYAQTVKLDARTFRRGGALPPSKKLGF